MDRQDIDALLVGALYGELSAADEAALTAHLDSHPGDRTALDDLKSIRTKFQTSRIFEVQHDPPQALSALLLQEAARRAPKIESRTESKQSWFQKFITMFVAHPSMAAAATLVLVVGVAGTVYMKSGPVGVEPTVAQSQEEITRLPAPAAPVAWGSAALAIGHDEGGDGKAQAAGEAVRKESSVDSVTVGLAENHKQIVAKPPAEKQPDVERFKAEAKPHATVAAVASKMPMDPNSEVAFGGDVAGKADQKAKKPYVEVGHVDHTPKDLDRAGATNEDKIADATVATGAAAGPKGGASGGAPGSMRSSTAPATSTIPKTTPTPPAQNAPQPVTVAAAEPPPPPTPSPAKVSKPATELAWAKDTHARVAALVKAGKCQDAAPLAIAIRNRTPDYYSTYVATDRELKPCMPYITDATEHSERAKAATKATETK